MKKQLEVTPRPVTPISSSQSETVCSRALAVSISQMMLGAAPPLAASAVPHQTVVPMIPAAALPLQATAAPAVVTYTARSVTHATAQLATEHPYAMHPSPPGFPYPPAEYSPYWGMFPYHYPYYALPPPPVHPDGRFTFTPIPESQPTQMMVDPVAYQTMAAMVDSSMLKVAQASPVPMQDSLIAPLTNPANPIEITGPAADGQGAICTVTPTLKTCGRR